MKLKCFTTKLVLSPCDSLTKIFLFWVQLRCNYSDTTTLASSIKHTGLNYKSLLWPGMSIAKLFMTVLGVANWAEGNQANHR